MEASKKLIDEVSIRKDEITKEGYHQTIMNIMYEYWQKDDVNMSYSEILDWFESEYGELARFAVQIGKYNQQVTNGGHRQYYYNRYSGNEKDITLHQKLIAMFPKELSGDKSQTVLKILERFNIELDYEQYIEEERYICETDEVEIDEYENPDYMEIINNEELDQLDKQYYKYCEVFMEILEVYFQSKIRG